MNIKFKRFLAYIIDLSIIFVIIFLLKNILITNKLINFEQLLSNLNEKLLNKTITFSNYIKEASTLIRYIDKESILINLSNIALISFFTIIYPYYCDNKTIGSKLMKLTIVPNSGRLKIHKLIRRSEILYGYIHLIVIIPLPYILNNYYYYIVSLILSFVQILLVIISGFMVLYRKDMCGLQDIISKTHIEEN